MSRGPLVLRLRTWWFVFPRVFLSVVSFSGGMSCSSVSVFVSLCPCSRPRLRPYLCHVRVHVNQVRSRPCSRPCPRPRLFQILILVGVRGRVHVRVCLRVCARVRALANLRVQVNFELATGVQATTFSTTLAAGSGVHSVFVS